MRPRGPAALRQVSMLLCAAAVSACSNRAPVLHAPAPEVATGEDAVVPVHTDLHLAVDPRAPTLNGTARIHLEIRRSIRRLVLDFAGTIAWAIVWQDGTEFILRVDRNLASLRAERVEFLSPELLHPGEVLLDLGFTSAPISEGGPAEKPGIFRRWQPEPYVYTGFERNGAHQVFPCFDDPRFHTTFSLTLDVPPQFNAFSNMPVRRQERSPQGGTRVAFEQSPPLPTYLWAFAVGKPTARLDDSRMGFVDLAGGRSRVDLPLARQRLDELTEYFGAPPAFSKLDLLFVDGDGLAMEHPGLITFALPWNTVTGGVDGVLTHELAHLWFGDQVGIREWQDEWLKEGLASWLEERITGIELDARDVLVVEEQAPGTIRVPVPQLSARKREQALYTYSKASRVLRMVEQWLGEATFQRGIRHFVHYGRWQPETPRALYRALATATDAPVADVLESFVSQPGFPVIQVSWQCAPQRPGARVTIDLAQTPFKLGEQLAREPENWSIPVCLRLGGDGVDVDACRVLRTRTHIAIDVPACPRWVYPNRNATGYYRWQLPIEQLEPLLTDFAAFVPLAQREILDDLWSNVQSGSLGVDGYLELLARAHLGMDDSNWPAIVATLDRISATGLGPDAHRRFVKRLSALTGWAETTTMATFVSTLWTAPSTIMAAARALELCEDPSFEAELEKLARDPELPKASPELVALVYRALGRGGHSDDARRLLDQAVSHGKGREATWLAAGMRDPSILPALAPLFDPSSSLTDLAALASTARDRTELRDDLLAGQQTVIEAFRMAVWRLGRLTCDPAHAPQMLGAHAVPESSRVHCAWLDRAIESSLTAPAANRSP